MWNDAAQTLFGWRRSEVLGMEVSDDEARRLADRALGGSVLHDEELVPLRDDGEPVPLSVSGSPVRDDEGAVLGAVFFAVPVGLRREACADAAAARAVAHEFNNLLTAISGYSTFLVERLPEGHPLRRDAEQIAAAAGRAVSLTTRLTELVRRAVRRTSRPE